MKQALAFLVSKKKIKKKKIMLILIFLLITFIRNSPKVHGKYFKGNYAAFTYFSNFLVMILKTNLAIIKVKLTVESHL